MKTSKIVTKPNVETVVEEHGPRLRSFIRNRVSNNEDAEDILHDVFYQLARTVEYGLNPIEHVTAWLYRVARNTIINKGKKKCEQELPRTDYDDEGDIVAEFSEVLFNDDNPTPETEYLRSLVWMELEKALSELPAEQRIAFELTELEGLPAKEIAETMGITLNTFLSRKHYAVKHLRKCLKELYDDILEA